MLSEIPRKPVFPQHMFKQFLNKIEKEVEEEIIPLFKYTQYKLEEQLSAIPKPIIVNYQDKIFYDTIEAGKFEKKSENCPICREQYGNKKNTPLQCKFCGIWNCSECICHRKRYHPRAKDSTSDRFDICNRCDDKFLSLHLNHGYVEQKCLLEKSIDYTKNLIKNVEIQTEILTKDINLVQNNKIKISGLKKNQIDNNKDNRKIQEEIKELNQKLKIRNQYKYVALQKKKLKIKEKQQRKKVQIQERQRIRRQRQQEELKIIQERQDESNKIEEKNSSQIIQQVPGIFQQQKPQKYDISINTETEMFQNSPPPSLSEQSLEEANNSSLLSDSALNLSEYKPSESHKFEAVNEIQEQIQQNRKDNQIEKQQEEIEKIVENEIENIQAQADIENIQAQVENRVDLKIFQKQNRLEEEVDINEYKEQEIDLFEDLINNQFQNNAKNVSFNPRGPLSNSDYEELFRKSQDEEEKTYLLNLQTHTKIKKQKIQRTPVQEQDNFWNIVEKQPIKQIQKSKAIQNEFEGIPHFDPKKSLGKKGLQTIFRKNLSVQYNNKQNDINSEELLQQYSQKYKEEQLKQKQQQEEILLKNKNQMIRNSVQELRKKRQEEMEEEENQMSGGDSKKCSCQIY